MEKINKDIKIYSTNEVKTKYPSLDINVVKEGNLINVEDKITIEVVHAEHGYIPLMKGTGGKVIENVGYIIDDKDTKVYITSDTICFENDFKCDVLCIPVSDHGDVMGAYEAALVAKDTNAKLVIPLHADNPKYPVDFEYVKEMFEKHEVEYEKLENDETIEIE